MQDILHDCHASPYSRHHRGNKTASKVLQSGFYWPKIFRDTHEFAKKCDRCQRIGSITRRQEMLLQEGTSR